MTTIQTTNASRTALIRFDPGEDLLQGLQQAVDGLGFRNASIVSGAGSLTRYHVHVVETTNLPPGNVFWEEDGAFDILAVTGLVIEGRVHAHLTVSNPERAMGGHLEDGCQVLTFAMVTLLELPDTDFTGWDTSGPLDIGTA